LHDRGAALHVTWDEPVGLLGDVEQDGRRLGDDEAVVVDDRDLMERADSNVGLAVELAGCLVQRVEAVAEPHLFERPLHAEILRLSVASFEDVTDAVECDHGVMKPLYAP
jgi:hypothetical protein